MASRKLRKTEDDSKKRITPKVNDDDHKFQLALMLKRDLIETHGFIVRAAHRTAISRRIAYDMIKRWGLWPVVNEARRQRVEQLAVEGNDLLQRTKLSMRG